MKEDIINDIDRLLNNSNSDIHEIQELSNMNQTEMMQNTPDAQM